MTRGNAVLLVVATTTLAGIAFVHYGQQKEREVCTGVHLSSRALAMPRTCA